MSKLKLFVKVDGQYRGVDSFLMNEYTKPIIKCKVVDAFDKYIKNITSKKCIKNQRNEKRYFAALVKHIDVEYICDVKAYHIENYIAASLREIKASSVERRLATIRHFFNVCMEWEYILTNPMVKLKKLKIERNHFKTWSEIEYKNFIELCDGDYLNIIKFMHLTGARPSEVFSLRWLDIDYTEMIIKLRCGKNANISRDFPLTKKLEKLFHKMGMKSGSVFLVNGKKITNDNLYQYAKHRLKKLNYNHLTIYGLRHFFAARLCKAGMNAFQIQNLLGHVDIKTTLNYVTIERKDLIDLVNKAI